MSHIAKSFIASVDNSLSESKIALKFNMRALLKEYAKEIAEADLYIGFIEDKEVILSSYENFLSSLKEYISKSFDLDSDSHWRIKYLLADTNSLLNAVDCLFQFETVLGSYK